MMFASVLASLTIFGASVAAQNTPSVVCVAGQCVQGFTNLSVGAVLSASGAPTSLLLLPGQYTDSTNPQLLHTILTASSASLASSPGFSNSSAVSLPLSLQLQPGLATYANANFSGAPSFIALPANASNTSTPLTAGSLVLASNTWAQVIASNNARLVLWDSAPDLAQLPSNPGALTLTALQSAACTTPCARGGTCSAQGTCSCAPGFTGSSCEACASGFFGPTCQACPAGCAQCDEGLGGSGRCLKETVANAPASCNCLNGVCGAGGTCACNAGWINSSNGTQCATCAPGFFLSGDGSCKVCQLGCTQCADQSGTCITCKAGFTQDANDRTKCVAPTSATSAGQPCPDGSFANGAACAACSPLCQTCTAGTSNDCVVCGAGRYALNGTCVQTDASGVCQTANAAGQGGTGLVADNNKRECEACPPKCTACGIAAFSIASTIDQAKCTACLPGFVLSNGQCIESCPSGTFLDPKDNVTCTACDSSCSSCVGSSNFCLTCANNQLASAGACVTSCPSTTFSSSGACVACHPDCATCTGTAFNQCASCPSDRPVLANGRCLSTCSKTEFFDATSGSCKACDGSCSSCSAAGPQGCLACADSNGVLRAGKCVAAACANGTSVVQGLGTCLSDLVAIPQVSGTASAAPLPSITGITSPTVPDAPSTEGNAKLEWWQILLMALGCAFIALLVLLCLRRRMRKKRAQQTAEFARQKNLDVRLGWRGRLVRFGERLFGHTIGERALGTTRGRARSGTGPIALEEGGATKMRDAEDVRHSRDMDKLLDAYAYPRQSVYTHSHSRAPSLSRAHSHHLAASADPNRLSDASMYTELTGQRRRAADARQPVKDVPVVVPTHLGTRRLDRKPPPQESRFSGSTYSSFASSSRERLAHPGARTPTPAEEYALSVLDTRFKDENAVRAAAQQPQPDYGALVGAGSGRGEYWLRPTNTGDSGGSASKNPFRR